MNRLLASVLFAAPAIAVEDAARIMEQTQARAQVKSLHYEGVLQMTDAAHRISTRSWTLDRLGSSGESKTLLRFTAPVEVKGLALLIVNHADRESDQWMWTPAIQRERRIAAQDRSTRFFGTDFSFEDLEERDVHQFDYRLLGEESTAWKIEARPKQTKSSQYTSSVLRVRKSDHVVEQIENYVKDKLVRRLRYSDIAKVDGIWTPRTVEAHDAVRDSTTLLRLEKLEYNLPFKAEEFTVDALRK